MHQLYWSPNSGSLAPMAVLEALKETTGADYRAVKVDTKAGEHRTSEYLTKVHPLGTVPALQIDGAKTLLESSAMHFIWPIYARTPFWHPPRRARSAALISTG